jgi:hypothetical protein
MESDSKINDCFIESSSDTELQKNGRGTLLQKLDYNLSSDEDDSDRSVSTDSREGVEEERKQRNTELHVINEHHDEEEEKF